MNIWIGYEHLDRLITYPDAPFLSRCAVPIRMRRSYPDAPFLSRCAVPIQMRRSYPEATTEAHPHHALRLPTPAPRPSAPSARRAAIASSPPTPAPRATAPGPPPAHTKRARTNRSGRATKSAQALGRLPWFAPFLRRSRRLRPRFDMSFSLGLLSRLKHFCTH